MNEARAWNEAPGRSKNGNRLVPLETVTSRARRGSIASIFEHASHHQSRKDSVGISLDGKGIFPIIEDEQAEDISALHGKASAEQLEPATVKSIPPPKKHRKRRKTLHDAETHYRSTRFAECLEVTQSRWVQNPEDPSREIVTLTGEVTRLDSETLDSSFRWIHYHREAGSISFEDFEKVLDKDQGLYEDEAAVASHCVREAKLKRRTFGRGKYFEPIVHEVSDVMGTSEVEKVPIKATFISIPILALMNKSKENLPYLNRHALRTPARHPIRSLLQYSNILALDTERDKRQVSVVTKLGEDEPADEKPFIHVPEFWALVINMYTVITCAPFSSEVLLGENIQLVQPPTNRQRSMVKFTSLRGTLHDLRCQTWFGLLDAISRIEWHVKDVDLHLNDPSTEYKIIDLKFRPIDQDRWIKLTEAKSTRHISVRLVRIPKDTKLTLEFAAKKLRACVNATWVLLGLPYQEDILEAKLEKALESSAAQRDIDNLRLRLDGLEETEQKFTRSRYFNRMLLYAARAHILNPKESSTVSGMTKARRTLTRVVTASKLGSALPPDRASLSSLKRDLYSNTTPVFYENRLKTPEIAIRTASAASDSSELSHPVPQFTFGQSSRSRPVSGNGRDQQGVISTAKSPHSWFEGADETEKESATNHYANPFATVQPQTRGSVSMNRRPSLWAPAPDHSDRVPLAEGRIVPAIVDPYSSGLSELAAKECSAFEAPQYGASKKLLRPRPAGERRHSSFGIAGEVLAPSPMRLPLRTEDHTTSVKQPASSFTPPDLHTPQPQQVTTPAATNRRCLTTYFTNEDDSEPVTLVEKAIKRAKDNIGSRTPFFQWPTHAEFARAVGARPVRQVVETKTERAEVAHAADSGHGSQTNRIHAHAAHDILSDIDSFIANGKYHDAPKFDVSPSDYNDVMIKHRSEVMSMLQAEVEASSRPSLELGADIDDPITLRRHFAESKMQLMLSVHGLVECFIDQDEVDAKVIGKIWGLMYCLCELQVDATATVPDPVKREIKFVKDAAKEVEKMEHKVKELLHMDQQHDAAKDGANELSLHLPPPLFAAFMDFILFLLSIHLAVWEVRVNDETVNIVKEKVYHGLHESHTLFLRRNEHLEMDLDQIGYESIRAADSILGLLLENALNISCREGDGIANDGTEMDFDVVDVYSRYTSNAIDRAKQEASARVYEDIRLLREEIDTISLILKHQFTLFQRMIDARESALQNLDKRFIYRINTNLDESIRHFSTLSNYAIQAEFWARNSIEVRSEANNKAIYVFTAVTVIFLPLSFVTGLLGMNTYDIRNMSHGQWLFWATALPFTFAVLIICLFIVNYKFKLKKRVRRFILKNRMSRSFRRAVRNAYFHSEHAGYGLRLLLPFGFYQRWRVRKIERDMKLKQYETD